MNRARPFALLLAAALCGCATARTVSEDDRHSLERAWDGKAAYLRSSLNVLPFFGEADKRLVSPLYPDSIQLPAGAAGAQALLPGPVESVVPMGAQVRIEKLEFPTSLWASPRPLHTPRGCPWVYLSLPGVPRGQTYVAVLRASMTTREEVLAALGDLFSFDEPSLWLKNAGPETRKAIEEKRLLAGMDGEQVLLSWGRPERIRQDLESPACPPDNASCIRSPVRVETWTWPLGVRTATFKDGRLSSAQPALEKRD